MLRFATKDWAVSGIACVAKADFPIKRGQPANLLELHCHTNSLDGKPARKRKNVEPAKRNSSKTSVVSRGAKTAKQKRLEKNTKTAATSKVTMATRQPASAGKAKAKRDQPKPACQIDKATPQSKSAGKRKSQTASKASVKSKGMKKV